MKKLFITAMAFIISVVFVPMVLAQHNSLPAGTETGKRVTLTGCLHKGTSWNTFALLGVTERPADGSASASAAPVVIYWLDSTAGLKPLVGRMVAVTGKVAGKEPRPGTMTVSIDPRATLSTDVTLESDGRNITTNKFGHSSRSIGTSDASSSVQSRPVYRLTVADVRPVQADTDGPVCQ